MDRAEVISLLRGKQGKDNIAEYAKRIGVHPELLRMIYKGQRDPRGKVLDYLGLKKVVSYEKS